MLIFKESCMNIGILGTSYELKEVNRNAPNFPEECDGYTDTSTKELVVDEMKECKPGMKKNLLGYQAQVKRHEIIHGFLFESGLDNCCEWACEEMVDWLAIQFPKLRKTFEEAGCL